MALIVDLDRDLHLLVHLRMTGQLVVVRRGVTVLAGGQPSRSLLDPTPNPTTRMEFRLSGQRVLYFNDQRKFGWIRCGTRRGAGRPVSVPVGPEPSGEEFTLAGFRARLAAHPRAVVKAAL